MDGRHGGPRRAGTAAAVTVLVGAAGAGVAAAVRRRRGRGGGTPGSAGGVPRLAGAFPEAVLAGDALRRAGLSVAVAESCTGGLLGAALTSVPGSSAYMLGGVVAYADEVKRTLLGVPAEVLEAHGAVSEPVAVAMAAGARRRTGADVGVGVTGVAGPEAEGTDKPAGLVFVACAGPGAGTSVVRLHRDLGREGNRAAAVRAALRLVAAATADSAR